MPDTCSETLDQLSLTQMFKLVCIILTVLEFIKFSHVRQILAFKNLSSFELSLNATKGRGGVHHYNNNINVFHAPDGCVLSALYEVDSYVYVT